MSVKTMQQKVRRKLKRWGRHDTARQAANQNLPASTGIPGKTEKVNLPCQRGESSLLAALCILSVLVWMSAIPLLYFQRLMNLGKNHGRVQLLTAVSEEIHTETIRGLQRWLLPRIGRHLQTALEASPAFRNEMINGRNPLPTDEYRKTFFKRSFFVPHGYIQAENNQAPVRDPRLNSVRSYLDSLGSGIVIDMDYVGLSAASRPETPEYVIACHIRTLARAEDGGEQVRDSQFTCLFRPRRLQPEDEPTPNPDFPVLTLYPLYTGQ